MVSAWYRGGRGEREGLGGKRGGGGKGGEMTQTLYAHMNKIKIKKKDQANAQRGSLLAIYVTLEILFHLFESQVSHLFS
jgi:hypothetical protein